jgi:uncharacterized phage infection (PIP) family protein YhgE
MKRFNTILALSILGLVALTACGEETKTVTGTAKDTTGKVADTAKDAMGKTSDTAKDAIGKISDTAKDATGKTADTAKDAMSKIDNAKSAAEKSVGMASGLAGMKDGVNNTLTAVKAGDFAKAKTEATELQASWGKISETVEKQSAGSYKNINDGLKNVQASLKDAKPDKTKIVAQLQSLATSVTGLIAKK